ncbi:hypothetical protein [Microcoleus sp. B5-D4]
MVVGTEEAIALYPSKSDRTKEQDSKLDGRENQNTASPPGGDRPE